MPPPDDVSIGEVMRMLVAFREDTREDFQAVNRRIDAIDTVPAAVYAADKVTSDERLKAALHRINKLEQAQSWLIRTVGAAIITALVAGWAVIARGTG